MIVKGEAAPGIAGLFPNRHRAAEREHERRFQSFDLAVLWIAAPLIGLLIQPIVRHYLGRTWGLFRRVQLALVSMLGFLAILWRWKAAWGRRHKAGGLSLGAGRPQLAESDPEPAKLGSLPIFCKQAHFDIGLVTPELARNGVR